MGLVGKNTLVQVFNITPHNTNNISLDAGNTFAHTAVYVVTLTTGDVSLLTPEGKTISFTGLPAGIVVGPFQAVRVFATGTTATVAGGVVGNT